MRRAVEKARETGVAHRHRAQQQPLRLLLLLSADRDRGGDGGNDDDHAPARPSCRPSARPRCSGRIRSASVSPAATRTRLRDRHGDERRGGGQARRLPPRGQDAAERLGLRRANPAPRPTPTPRSYLATLGGDREHSSQKGYGLNVAVDLFCGAPLRRALQRADGRARTNRSAAPHMFSAWRIDAFVPMEEYPARFDEYIGMLHACPPLTPASPRGPRRARMDRRGRPPRQRHPAQPRSSTRPGGVGERVGDSVCVGEGSPHPRHHTRCAGHPAAPLLPRAPTAVGRGRGGIENHIRSFLQYSRSPPVMPARLRGLA